MSITLTLTRDSLKEEEFTFDTPAECVVGRAADCQIRIPPDLEHQDVSRHHCKFEIDPPHVYVQDLGSLNGTYVKGLGIGRRPRFASPGGSPHDNPRRELFSGDEVRVGDSVLEVAIDDTETSNDSVHLPPMVF